MSAAPIGGLAVSPTDASPIAQPRPKPPSSRRRSSLQPSATNSPRASPSPKPASTAVFEGVNGDDLGAGDTHTGTLDGRSEEHLLSASREALQEGLRKEWAQRDKLAAQLDELGAAQREQDASTAKLQNAHDALQRKYDAAFASQGSLEEQLEAANDIIDRLRKNLDEAERQVRTQQRRYADQEKAFEAERLVHQADQRGMVQRIKSLTAERIVKPSEQEGDAQAALQEELMTLSASHQTLVTQLTTLTDELHEVKGENARLQEENDSWQLLIEEKTLDGTMRGGLITSGAPATSPPESERALTPSSIRRAVPNTLETLEEQMEMDELHSELDAQTPIFADADRLNRARSPGANEVDLTSPTRPSGMSLASELGGASDAEALRTEIKRLKEANKALSLYCSKILDRIIASEGMEHILSVDYHTRRGSAPRLTGRGRPSVIELAKDMEANGPSSIPSSLPSPPSDDAIIPPQRRSSVPRPRPQSMYVSSESVHSARSVSSSSYTTGPPTPLESGIVSQPRANAADADKRARRGFSIDFRSLGFGAAEKTETKPQLKPLQLASRAAPAGQSAPVPSQSPPKFLPTPAAALVESPVAGARKLAPQEEDDEDRRERSRMEATLKLLGIDRSGTSPSSTAGSLPPEVPEKPTPGASSAAASAASAASGAAAWLSRRLQRAPSSTSTTSTSSQPTFSPAPLSPQQGDRGVTPLARLSEALGSSPGLELNTGAPDPEAALREYDAREAEHARLLAEGKGPAAYTSPPKLARRGRSSASSSLSRASGSGASAGTGTGAGANGFATSPELGATAGPPPAGANRHRPRESTSTLWSIGSSHE